ncbi:MAG: hypothetical protein ACLTSZ_04660 [Lachnospiraceae bacterium]
MGEEDLKIVNENGEQEDAKLFTLAVMGGGIVGRIGEAVLLSVDADQADPEEINKEKMRLPWCKIARAAVH